MFRLSPPVTLQLARGELIAWPRASAVEVKVITGCVWITRHNDFDDHLLRPGQSLRIGRGALALIEGECESTLRVQAAPGWQPLRAGMLRRLLRGPRAAAATAAA